MGTRKIIYTTGFKAGGLSQKKGLDTAKAWVDYRFEFWMRYTYNSVLNQDNPDWEYWFIVDETSHNLLGERFDRIEDDRVKVVFRHDQLAPAKEAGDYDYYMVLRLDSDDMYHHAVTDDMMTVLVDDGRSLYRYVQYIYGYIYKPGTKQLKHWWRSHMSPPFFARVFPNWEWEQMIGNKNIVLNDGGHAEARRFKRNILGRGKFLVGVHEANMVTTVGKRPEIFDEEEKRKILAEFGVDYPETDLLKSDVHDPWGLLPGGYK